MAKKEEYSFPYHLHPQCLECEHLFNMPEEDNLKRDCGLPFSKENNPCPIRQLYKN